MTDIGVSWTLVSLDKRAWAVRPEWIGWRRLLALGIVVNVAAPAITLWLLGWQVDAGRLVVEVTADLDKIAISEPPENSPWRRYELEETQ